MLPQQHDDMYGPQSTGAPRLLRANQRYSAEVPALALDEQSRLVDQVIRFAFETLGVYHLEVRVSGFEVPALAARSSARTRASAR